MPKKIKIVWHLPYAIIGGVETLYKTILKYIDMEKYDHYVTCHFSIFSWVRANYPASVIICEFANQHSLAKLFDLLKPDLVIGTHGGTLYAALDLCQKNYPVIEVVHGSHTWSEHNSRMPKDWTKKVVCVSNSAKRVYERAVRVKIKTEVIINGVDTEIFTPQKPLQREAKVVAYFGRFLESDKHITKIVQAFRIIGDVNARLCLIGGTPEELVRLKHLSRALKMSHVVRFFPHTDNPIEHYPKVDVSTVRSEAEGYCNSAAEALATGTPLVCYRFGGIQEHVSPGTIAVADNQPEYAKLLREVYKNYTLRKKMRKLGLDFIKEKGNAYVMADRYEAVIEEVLSSKSIRTFLTKTEKVASLDPVIKATKSSSNEEPRVEVLTKEKPIVGIFNPHWHGIATATRNCTTDHVFWNKDPNKMVSEALRYGPRAVLFSGMCPGFDSAIQIMKKRHPQVKVFAYYHGGISHYSFSSGLFGEGERKAFQKMLDLQKKGFLRSIAVSSPGLAEVLRANGYSATFCGNIREFTVPERMELMSGFNIGNWNRNHDHKHTSIGIGAAQLIPGAKIHCLKGYPVIPGIDTSIIKSYAEMPQLKLFSMYRQMRVNLQMSFIETFNISVLEMWAAGRPVVLGPGNSVLLEGNPFLKNLMPKDSTNPVHVARAIREVDHHSDEVIKDQYLQLEKLNKESKNRWEIFFR